MATISQPIATMPQVITLKVWLMGESPLNLTYDGLNLSHNFPAYVSFQAIFDFNQYYALRR